MLKLMTISVATIALAVTAWMLLPLPGYRAAADTGALYINAVDIDIQPGHIDTFLTSLKADGAAAVKEPGCREFDITVRKKTRTTSSSSKYTTTPRRSKRTVRLIKPRGTWQRLRI